MSGKIQFLTERLVTFMIDSFWTEKWDQILKITSFFNFMAKYCKNALKTLIFAKMIKKNIKII